MAQKNIEDRRAYDRQWYRDHKSQIIDYKKKYVKEFAQWFFDLKSDLSCEMCGENYVYCLEFHHIDKSNKELSVSDMVKRKRSKKSILEEISKCIVLCANCHRKLHFQL